MGGDVGSELMFEVREKPKMVQSAFLIGAYLDRSEEALAGSLLEELAELVETLGIEVRERALVYVRDSNKRYLTGKGKAHELMEAARESGCDCIVFDNELLPGQQRAWEAEGDICVIDRQEVILDIFAMRARTKEARLQVDLARMEYSLPRLARMWTHLDRQGGGAGGGKGGGGAARGEGEKQIEVDRRIARRRIDRAKRELEEIRKQRGTRRKEREKLPVPHAAIVGYTNAGKSSLLNKLAGADVLVEDKLFATLDTTTRRLDLPDGQSMLMTDTVGFVRRLPHRLVESFKATLEESVLADFLVHVLDSSSPDIYDHHSTTLEVLGEMGAEEKQIITVLNKVDLLEGDAGRLHELQTHFDNAVFVSVKTGEGLDKLVARMNELLMHRVVRLELRVPPARHDVVALARREGKLLGEGRYAENGDVLVGVVVPRRWESKFLDFVVDGAGRESGVRLEG